MANIYDVNAAIGQPNIVGAFQQGLSFGQRQREQKIADEQRQQLRNLAPQVVAGDPNAYNAAAAIDPKAAQDFQGAGDAQLRRVRGLITYLENADKSGNPQVAQAAWQQYGVPFARQFSQGTEPTANWAEAKPMIEQLKARIALAESGTQDSDTVQSRFVGEDGQVYALLRSGSVRPLGIKADPNTQIIEGAGGFYGVDRRNLQATPVQVGAPAQVASIGSVQPGTGFTIDPSVPPEVAAQIRQQESQAGGVPTAAPMPAPQLQAPPRDAPAAWAPLTSDEIQNLGLPPGTVAQRNLQTGQVQTIRTPTAAQTTAAQGRPLPVNVVTKLSTDSGKLSNLGELQRSFQNDFAGSGFGGGAENLAGRLGFPGATPGQAEWWQQYDRYKNEVRNELFGASLTEGEQRAFEAADITPNMDPKVIKSNLAKQSKIIEEGLKRQARTWAAQGYNREAIREAAGIDVGDSQRGRADGDIPRPSTQAEFDALPSGSVYIDPDDGRQYRKQ